MKNFIFILFLIITLSGCINQADRDDDYPVNETKKAVSAEASIEQDASLKPSEGSKHVLTDTRERAIQLAKEEAAKLDVYQDNGFKVLDVIQAKCLGCWKIFLESVAIRQPLKFEVPISAWEVGEIIVTEEKQISDDMIPEECIHRKGRVLNTVGGSTCRENEASVGNVTGLISPHMCCVPKEMVRTGNVGDECQANQECKLPMDYAIRSNCPYASLCYNGSCKVVCPMFSASTELDGIACQKDNDCKCQEFRSEGECVCIQNHCASLVE